MALLALAAAPPGRIGAAPDELDGIAILPLDPATTSAQILAARPFVVPGDTCPVFCIAAPDDAVPLDESAARARLSRFLIARDAPVDVQAATLERFDAPETIAIVSDPTLRASLLMLSGWSPYDAVVAAVLDGENQSGLPFADVSFQAFDSPAIAFLGGTADGLYALRVNRDFAAEAPETLANVVIHETLHDPYANSYEEEVIANILDGVAYAEILLVRPELAATGTTLTVYNNYALLALLNSSGGAGPTRLGVATSRFGDVWLGPELGGSDASSLRDAIADDNVYADLPRGGTPGGPVLTALLDPFPEASRRGPDPEFDEATLDAIDADIGRVISPPDAVSLARTLRLSLAVPPTEVPFESISPLPSDPEALLAARPFIPRDVAHFDPTLPAVDRLTPRSEASARTELASVLTSLGTAPADRLAILDRFDDDLGARIASPSLRAAAALLGALPAGAPVAAALIESPRGSALAEGPDVVVFAPRPHGTSFAIVPADAASFRIEINERLAGESLDLLASTLLESILSLPVDGTERASEDQAVLAAAVSALTYAELLIASPDLAEEPSWATARQHRAILALLNSSPVPAEDETDGPNGSLGLLNPAQGVADVLPNLYPDPRSFEADVLTRPGATDLVATRRLTAPSLAVAVAEALGVEAAAGGGARPPTFGDLVVSLDARLGDILLPNSIARLAEALDLGVA